MGRRLWDVVSQLVPFAIGLVVGLLGGDLLKPSWPPPRPAGQPGVHELQAELHNLREALESLSARFPTAGLSPSPALAGAGQSSLEESPQLPIVLGGADVAQCVETLTLLTARRWKSWWNAELTRVIRESRSGSNLSSTEGLQRGAALESAQADLKQVVSLEEFDLWLSEHLYAFQTTPVSATDSETLLSRWSRLMGKR